jgi:RecG-like helicase
MAEKMNRMNDMDNEVHDLTAIADAMKKIPSDLNASPANAQNAAKRMLATIQPNLPFNLAKDSKRVMEAILKEEQESEVFGKIRKEKQESVLQAWR